MADEQGTAEQTGELTDEYLEKFAGDVAEALEETPAEPAPKDDATAAEDDRALDEIVGAETQDRGDGRDAKGRFAEKPGEKESGETAAPAPDATPAPTTETPAESTAPPAEGDKYLPATYRADGQEYGLPGSAVGEDGVFIPTKIWPEVQQKLASADAYHRQAQEWQEEKQGLIGRIDLAEKAYSNVVGKLQDLFKSEKLVPWLENIEQNWPQLIADAELDMERTRREQAETRLEARDTAQRDQALMPQLHDDLRKLIDQKVTAYDGFTAKDKAIERLGRRISELYFYADADDPAGRWRKGDLLVDHPKIDAELRDLHELTQGSRTAAAKAAKESAEAVTSSSAPPTVSAAGGPAPSPNAVPPVAKTREEADKLLDQAARRLAKPSG